MDEKKLAAEAKIETTASQQVAEVVATTTDDLEAKNLALEAEKARLTEEKENYRLAYLKSEKKRKEEVIEDDGGESMEDKMRRISAETLANSRLNQIAIEQEALIKRALKENGELKRAQSNKTTTTANTTSTEVIMPVRSTEVTQDQAALFKAKGWNDKDIERYKKNLQKNR